MSKNSIKPMIHMDSSDVRQSGTIAPLETVRRSVSPVCFSAHESYHDRLPFDASEGLADALDGERHSVRRPDIDQQDMILS